MNGFFPPFAIGLFCTVCLFVLSFFIVVGAKTVYESLKNLLPKKEQNIPTPKKTRPKPRKPKSPQVVRTIEIDPTQVDKIYVKKAQ